MTREFARPGIACVALAAVLLQILLSFGHFHAPGNAFPSGIPQRAVATAVAHAQPELAFLQDRPAGLADEDEHCVICFSGFLLSNGSLPDAPQHRATFAFSDAGTFFKPIMRIALEQRRASFLSRAPPAN